MNLLLHRSHCSATQLDGWSGAPGEAAYIRALCDRIANSCRTLGIGVTIVDGDLEDHPEFHQDWDCFVAPHYDANVYNDVGGTFWGRAAASPTGAQDDALGAAIWSHLRAIPSAPAERFGRLNANVTDYYGFRLTTAKTPGVLIELGVGAPGAPDYLWLRAYQQDIADAVALGLAQFAGITITGIAEEDMETPEQTYARIAPLLQQNIVAPQNDTNIAIKKTLEQVAASGSHVNDAALGEAITKVGEAIELGLSKVGADVAATGNP